MVSKSVKAANPNDLEASNGEVGESSSSSTKLSKKEKKKLKAKTNEDLQFLNYEDELFYKVIWQILFEFEIILSSSLKSEHGCKL